MSGDSVTTTIAGRALHSPVLPAGASRPVVASDSVEAEAYKYIEVEAVFWGSSMLPPQINEHVAQTTD